MKLLLLGKSGNVGKAFVELLTKEEDLFDSCFVSRPEIDYLNPQSILDILNSHKPQIIINTAAYTQVDAAENNADEAHQINVIAPEVIANWAVQYNALIIHFSTDYVFDGKHKIILTENSTTNPLNVYGKTKLEGEKRILESGAKAFIFRTSWIFAPYGNNFFITMLKLGQTKKSLKIVNDQIGSPTYSYSLAHAVIRSIKKHLNSNSTSYGIYHIHNKNFTSWFKFAQAIFEKAQMRGIQITLENIDPISTEEYNALALRPKNTILSCDKFEKEFGFSLPDWETDLDICFDEYIKIKNRTNL